jgi:hypothetical protein|uniref:Uncharacterized protein n=1 Tax=Siphoviridae sp. ct1yA16 TaxID=2827767 RepID=A0A8S5TFK1_9CAUD|nr:MAG TPA: hypothetical protein [Siphoviridae sp. ct1yA16]
MRISDLLLKLIEKKYYAEKEQIENKLNIFYAMNKISDEEYSSLVLKAEEVYAEATDTEETDNITEETTANTEEKAEE